MLVKEAHCQGHLEPREISVADCGAEQGCEEFEALNREWYQLVLTRESAGPAAGHPPQASLRVFFMASYDLHTFRRLVLSDSFRGTYRLADDFYAEVEQDDVALLRFTERLLPQVLAPAPNPDPFWSPLVRMIDAHRLAALLKERLDMTLAVLQAVQADSALLAATLDAASRTAEAINRGGTLFICGNGGSAGEATHLSGELIGPFADKIRRPLPAIALGFDTSAVTAVANDFSFDEIFARQVAALARPGDVLWALSTSGRSPNVVRALDTAAARGLLTVLLTGARHADLPASAEIVLAIPSRETPRIQELHLVLGHFMCEAVEALAGGGST